MTYPVKFIICFISYENSQNWLGLLLPKAKTYNQNKKIEGA